MVTDFSLAPGEVDVWTMRFPAAPAPDPTSLSEDELLRAALLYFEDDRRRFTQSHVFVRRVLSGYLSLDPRDIRFATGPQGKPALAADMPAGLAFNLTHSRNCAMIAVAITGKIGIDVEDLTSIDDLDQLVRMTFSEEDASAILALPVCKVLTAFLRGWTRKEAALKALGVGLAIDPGIIRVPFCNGGPRRIEFPGDPAPLELIDIDLCGVIGALATDTLGARVRLREFLFHAEN